MAREAYDPRHTKRGFPLAEWDALSLSDKTDEAIARSFESQLVGIRVERALGSADISLDDEPVVEAFEAQSAKPNTEALKELVAARRTRLAKEQRLLESRRAELARYAGNTAHLGLAG